MISIAVGFGDILRNAIFVVLPTRSEAKICIKRKKKNGGKITTPADGVQSSFEGARVQSFWEAL